MRSRLIVLIAVALFMLPPAAALGDASNPFEGHWVGTDGIDGSRNTLTVGGGSNHVIYRETGVKACLDEFGEFVGGSAAGFATIDGDTLTFTATLYCDLEDGKVAHPYFQNFVWAVEHDPVTDTVGLIADPDTTLSRSGG